MPYEHPLGFGHVIQVRGYMTDDRYRVAFHYGTEYEESALVGSLKQHLGDEAPVDRNISVEENVTEVIYNNREDALEHAEAILETTQRLFLDERPSYDDPVFADDLEKRFNSGRRFGR